MGIRNAAKILKSYFPQNQSLDIIFINSDPDYTIKFFVNKDHWKNNEIVKRLRSIVEYIKSNGINKNINLVLIDNQTFDEEEI